MGFLRLIGYWRSKHEPHWPDPAWFVDSDWSPSERAQLASFLRNAPVPWAQGGFSWCRFRCGIPKNGSAEHTDGRFVWPEGLAHYVEVHAVRLPDEFVHAALSGAAAATEPVKLGVEIDTTWWAAQRGFRQGESFVTEAARGRFVAHLQHVHPTPAVLQALREFEATRMLSLRDLQEHISNGHDLVVLSDAFEMPRPRALEKLENLGVVVSFVESMRQAGAV